METSPEAGRAGCDAVSAAAGRFFRGRILWICGILLLALAMRLAGIVKTEVWGDEAATLMLARAPWWDLLAHLSAATDHPSLAFLPFKAWSLLFHAEWGMRLLPVLLGVGAVGVLMQVACRIDPRAAIPTGLLAAVSPVPVHYSQELRCYSLLFLLTALALWAAQGVQRRPASQKRVALLSILAVLAANTHVVGLFIYPMCVAFVVVAAGRAGLRALLGFGGIWLYLLLVSPMIWFCLGSYGSHTHGWWIPQVSLSQARYYLEEYFGLRIAELWQEAQHPRPFWTGFVLERLLMLGPAVLGILALVDRRLRRPVGALLAAGAVYVGLMVASSLLLVPDVLVRTLLPGWAPVLVLLGLGGAAVVKGQGRALPFVSTGTLLCLYAAGWIWFAEAGPPRRPPARDLYSWIRSRLGPHDVVVCAPPGVQELTAYYLGDVLSCDRLLGTSVPLIAGSPPARRAIPPAGDPNWQRRLRAALMAATRASGGKYSVWYLQAGPSGEPECGSIPGVLSERHCQAEQFSHRDFIAFSVIRYIPLPPSARQAP